MAPISDSFTSPTRIHSGHCLCSAVHFTITDPPTLQYLCHCRNCQHLTGAGFQANCFFPREAFTLTKGEDNLLVYDCHITGSGKITHRHFCRTPGSPVYILPDAKPELVVVMAGNLDDFDEFCPTQETWVKNRCGWIHQIEGAESFDESRPLASGRLER